VSGALDGAVAVITGATGGIGSARARMLARAGARVVLMGRSQPALARLAEEVGALDARACDLTETPAARRILRELPAPDILVNCAGGNRPKPFLELGDEDLAWSWQVNVVAALTAAQEVARRMVADGRGGAIVTVTSQMGHVGGRDRTAYCAAKHALEGAARRWRSSSRLTGSASTRSLPPSWRPA